MLEQVALQLTLHKMDLSCQPSKPGPALYSLVYIMLPCKIPYTEISRLVRKKHECGGVCKSTRGTREQGCKGWPVLIARDMINGCETGKLWEMCSFHQNHSMSGSPAETLEAAMGEWQRDCSTLLWHFSYRNPNKKSRFVSKLPKGKEKTSAAMSPKIYSG